MIGLAYACCAVIYVIHIFPPKILYPEINEVTTPGKGAVITPAKREVTPAKREVTPAKRWVTPAKREVTTPGTEVITNREQEGQTQVVRTDRFIEEWGSWRGRSLSICLKDDDPAKDLDQSSDPIRFLRESPTTSLPHV